jgi:hypothetical protein
VMQKSAAKHNHAAHEHGPGHRRHAHVHGPSRPWMIGH